jgi:hypothetical protein
MGWQSLLAKNVAQSINSLFTFYALVQGTLNLRERISTVGLLLLITLEQLFLCGKFY